MTANIIQFFRHAHALIQWLITFYFYITAYTDAKSFNVNGLKSLPITEITYSHILQIYVHAAFY